MDAQTWLMFFHIGAATIWVGGGATLALMGWRAARIGDLGLLTAFGRSVQYLGLRLLMPAMVILLIAGLALVRAEAHEFGEPWVLIGLGGFVLAFLIGAIYLCRTGIELGRVVAETSPDPSRMRTVVMRWVAGYAVILAILVVVLWDMIAKPGGM